MMMTWLCSLSKIKFGLLIICIGFITFLNFAECFISSNGLASKAWLHRGNQQFHHGKGLHLSSAITVDESGLWKERVEYIDLSINNVEPSPTARTLPLFLLPGAFYPMGESFLNIFEMKYRTMMFDCAKSDDCFGYIHTDRRSGAIASIGTLCKISDRQLLPDGRQYIAIDGKCRFRVRKILKTLPYILAEVETNVEDTFPSIEEAGVAAKLEREVYDALKYYIRLMRSYPPNSKMVVSLACKQSRPTKAILSLQEDHKRRSDFSFALANMIQMTHPTESQLLLQTDSVIKRLKAEKVILLQAAELVGEELIKMDSLSADARDSIKMRSYNDDDDSDIMPEDIIPKNVVEEKDEWDISNIE